MGEERRKGALFPFEPFQRRLRGMVSRRDKLRRCCTHFERRKLQFHRIVTFAHRRTERTNSTLSLCPYYSSELVSAAECDRVTEMGLFSFGKKKERETREYYAPVQSTSTRYEAATITPPRYYNTPPPLPPRSATLPAFPPPRTPTKQPTPPFTPPPPPRPTPPRPSTTPRQSGTPNQCSGTTANHARCTRTVNSATNLTPSKSPLRPVTSPSSPHTPIPQSSPRKSTKSINSLDKLDHIFRSIQLNQPDSPSLQPHWIPQRPASQNDDAEGVPRFCFQHSKQALVERGAFITGNSGKGEWVQFSDWIREDLPIETRVLLRYEMTRPLTGRDTVGFVLVPPCPCVLRLTAYVQIHLRA